MTKHQKKNVAMALNLRLQQMRDGKYYSDYLTQKEGQKINPEWEKAPFADAFIWEDGTQQETGLRFSAMDRKTPVPKWI